MTLSYVPAANAWLKSRNILVPGDWLEACVDWITEENQGVQLSQTQLNGLIYEQWLLADLKEIGSKCLPDQLTSSPKFQLSGTFALQVNSMVDVGKPYYGQLQKVQGTQSGNVDVTAEPAPPWEPKPTRMMMLNLSDGSLSIQGMEYKQIPCLNSQIKPGCKILVKGSVLCRRGILMLTAENLTVLGGEVDALVEDNTPVNSLKRAMEQSLQYSGKDYHKEFSSEGIIRSNNKKLKTEFPSQKIKREPPQSQPQAANSWNKPCRATVPEIKREAAIKQETREIDDEWEDDLDGWMDDMEDFDLDSVPPAPPSSVITQNSAPPNAETTSSKLHAMRAGSNGGQQSTQTKSKMAPQNHQITSSVTNTSQSRSVPLSNSVDQGISRNSLERVNKTKKVTETQYCQTAKQLMVKSDSPHNSAQTGTYSSGQTNLRTNLDIKPSVQHIDLTEQQFSDDDDFLDDLDDFDMSVEGNGDPCSKQSRVSVPQNVKDNACTLNTSGGTLPSSALSVGKKKLLKNTDKTDQREVDVSDIMSSCNQQQASPLATKPHIAGTSEKAGSQVKTARPGETTRQKPPEFTSLLSTETKIKELPVEAKPFTYLALVKKKIPVSQPIRFSVKAYVSTLTDKLSRPGGKRWQLACKINDGSAVLDVILSDKVLTEMIGFSAQETMEMTHLKADSLLMKKLTKGIKDCQQSLIHLLSVMEIVVSPGQDKPEIVSLREVNDQDILLLQSRVSEALCHTGS